jgi:hypothetical protein
MSTLNPVGREEGEVAAPFFGIDRGGGVISCRREEVVAAW